MSKSPTKRKPNATLRWVLMLAGVAVVWNSRFSADMSFFLPSKPTLEQQALVGQLKDGTVSRLLMLSIEGGDAPQRAAVSRELRKRLASDPAYVSVQNGEAGGLESERDVLLRYRYQLSPAVSPERFTEEGLKSAVTDTIDLLTSPAGVLLKPYLATSWKHLYGNVDSKVRQSSRLVDKKDFNSDFTIEGTALDRDSLALQAGVDWGLSAQQTISLAYTSDIGSDSRNHGVMGQWQMVLQWWNRTEFGQLDPQFGLDISFFVYELPFWRGIIAFASAVVLLAGIAGTIVAGTLLFFVLLFYAITIVRIGGQS